MFFKESDETQPSPQEEVQVLGAGLSGERKFLQTCLGKAEEPETSLWLEGTSC